MRGRAAGGAHQAHPACSNGGPRGGQSYTQAAGLTDEYGILDARLETQWYMGKALCTVERACRENDTQGPNSHYSRLRQRVLVRERFK